jgi:thiol-disulfide isomerase/thioredoxin
MALRATARGVVGAMAAGVLALVLSAVALSAQEGVRLPGLRGDALSEADLQRGSTVVVVWASWSPKCRDVPAQLETLDRDAAGAKVISISYQEEEAAAAAFVRERGLRGPVYLDRDGAFARRHGLATLPAFVVFRDGSVVARGRMDADAPNKIRASLRP